MIGMPRANRCLFAVRIALHFLAVGKLADHYPCLVKVKVQFSAVLENNFFFSNAFTSCSCFIGYDTVAIFFSILDIPRKKFFWGARRSRFLGNFDCRWLHANLFAILIQMGRSSMAIDLHCQTQDKIKIIDCVSTRAFGANQYTCAVRVELLFGAIRKHSDKALRLITKDQFSTIVENNNSFFFLFLVRFDLIAGVLVFQKN